MTTAFRTLVDAFECQQFAGRTVSPDTVAADPRQVGQIVGSRDTARTSPYRSRQTSAVSGRGSGVGGGPGRSLGEYATADVTQSVGDVPRQTVTAEHVTHVLAGHAVASDVRKISTRHNHRPA